MYLLQKEPTPAEQAHRLCSLLFRTGDNAFPVFISALKKAKQEYVADELLRIEKEGSV